MSDSDSNDTSIEGTLSNPSKWPVSRIITLIQLRLEMEGKFRSGHSKHSLWTQVYNQMKSSDPSMSLTLQDIQKKYSNLLLSYNRIKRSSRNQTPRWEFFEEFDTVLGQCFSDNEENYNQTSQSVTKIEIHSDDSVSFSSDDNDINMKHVYSSFVNVSPDTSIKTFIPDPDVQIVNGNPPINEPTNVEIIHETNKRKFTQIDNSTSNSTSRKKVKESVEVVESNNAWFKEYVKLSERREQIRHENLMEMERKKLEIETQKVQMFRELLDVVKKFLNK